MKNDPHSACVELIRTTKSGANAVRTSRPVALGWKLQSGMLPPDQVHALYESVHGAAAGSTMNRWLDSAPLRALLVEYQAVRRGENTARDPVRVQACRRMPRPVGSA